MKTHILSIAALMLAFMSCNKPAEQKQNLNEEKICEARKSSYATLYLQNGVNISHWLSQSSDRGEVRANKITKADFDSIAAMGFDFIRLAVDEEQLYDEAMNRDSSTFALMHNAINWALGNCLNVVVDLHIVRSHHFNNENGHPNTLFQDPKEQEKIVNIWKDLQKDLNQYPNDRLAYELMNEPVAPTCEDWNLLVEKMVNGIRETEKERTIIFGSNRWQIPQTFDSLRVPENDKYIMLSYHFYEPSLVTHHQAPWTDYAFYAGKVNYPGIQVTDSLALDSLTQEQKDKIASMNGEYNKEIMYEHMKLAIDKADSLGLQLYCGEFGAYPFFVDKDVRLRWYQDICDIFHTYNIANCHWCYKGDFPIVNEDGSANELPAIIIGKK
ncbi:MAG: cellulase family glycosylhydrolase [Paludibacteraceae bacterium]|nr:cellulase family glycosylhydrolase [Paludibacteraceae bacterium]